jgi:hypothetical protein
LCCHAAQGAKIRTALAAVAYVLALDNAINYANVNEALKIIVTKTLFTFTKTFT